MQIISILLIGIALSMDTFSLSLGIGTFNIGNKKMLLLASVVGVMHFFMPLLGKFLGSKLLHIFNIQVDFLLGIILIIIALQMLIDVVRGEEEKFNLNGLGIFFFALGVSLDSFSIGLGLNAITSDTYLATSLFAICSFSFTLGGLYLGKFASKLIGIYANIIGMIILFVLGLVHLI